MVGNIRRWSAPLQSIVARDSESALGQAGPTVDAQLLCCIVCILRCYITHVIMVVLKYLLSIYGMHVCLGYDYTAWHLVCHTTLRCLGTQHGVEAGVPGRGMSSQLGSIEGLSMHGSWGPSVELVGPC